MKLKRYEVDIMIGERYYGTFIYEHNPLFKFRAAEVVQKAESQYPTIKHDKYRLEIGHGQNQITIYKQSQ